MQASQCKPGGRVIRVARQRAGEGRSRFAISSEQLENHTCVGEILGSCTTYGCGADETVQRLRQLPCQRKSDAPVVQHVRVVRPNGNSPVKAFDCFSVALAVEQRDPTLNVRVRVPW